MLNTAESVSYHENIKLNKEDVLIHIQWILAKDFRCNISSHFKIWILFTNPHIYGPSKEKEISCIDLKKFKIVKSFENYKKTILFLKLKDQRKVVLKNPVSNFDKCGSSNSVYCIIENADNFEKSDLIFFKRKGLNTYLIKNEDNKAHNIILPFLYDKSWKTNKKNLSNINNSLIYVNLKSKEDLNLFYQNNLRILLKIVSLITFILCFVIILKKSIKFKN